MLLSFDYKTFLQEKAVKATKQKEEKRKKRKPEVLNFVQRLYKSPAE